MNMHESYCQGFLARAREKGVQDDTALSMLKRSAWWEEMQKEQKAKNKATDTSDKKEFNNKYFNSPNKANL